MSTKKNGWIVFALLVLAVIVIGIVIGGAPGPHNLAQFGGYVQVTENSCPKWATTFVSAGGFGFPITPSSGNWDNKTRVSVTYVRVGPSIGFDANWDLVSQVILRQSCN